ncbi:hypothetical protein D910_03517 [Dendroctonus ponderosae]
MLATRKAKNTVPADSNRMDDSADMVDTTTTASAHASFILAPTKSRSIVPVLSNWHALNCNVTGLNCY